MTKGCICIHNEEHVKRMERLYLECLKEREEEKLRGRKITPHKKTSNRNQTLRVDAGKMI